MTPSRFFEGAYQNFLNAVENKGKIELFYRLIGFTFCLQFAGEAMVGKLSAALAHLQIDPLDKCDFTLCVWDSVSTDTPPIELPWPNDAREFRGEIRGYNDARIHTVVDIHTKVLHVIDQERKLALYWICDFRNLPWWVAGSPFQLIFHWWMRSLGYQLTHTAAVGSSGSGVLLTGKSGSGKSTTALSCIRAGMQLVGEDYCLMSDSPDIWAHSMYNSAKIAPRTLEFFPELKRHIVNVDRSEGDKAFLFYHRFQPQKILAGFPIKALLVLKIEPISTSWLEPIEPKQALGPLSLTTLWQLTHTGPAVFQHLQRVTERLACYILHLGSEFTQIPQLIEKLL